MIRPFEPRDLPALLEITDLCFEHVSIARNIEARVGLINGHDWRWRKRREIEADVEGNRADGVLVAERDGQVIGYVTTRVDADSLIGWIPNLAVLPGFQGAGIGRQLLDAALQYLRQAGMEVAKMETLAQNPVGQRFYPSLGFEEVGRQIHYVRRL